MNTWKTKLYVLGAWLVFVMLFVCVAESGGSTDSAKNRVVTVYYSRSWIHAPFIATDVNSRIKISKENNLYKTMEVPDKLLPKLHEGCLRDSVPYAEVKLVLIVSTEMNADTISFTAQKRCMWVNGVRMQLDTVLLNVLLEELPAKFATEMIQG